MEHTGYDPVDVSIAALQKRSVRQAAGLPGICHTYVMNSIIYGATDEFTRGGGTDNFFSSAENADGNWNPDRIKKELAKRGGDTEMVLGNYCEPDKNRKYAELYIGRAKMIPAQDGGVVYMFPVSRMKVPTVKDYLMPR
jgi:hypothetical protein